MSACFDSCRLLDSGNWTSTKCSGRDNSQGLALLLLPLPGWGGAFKCTLPADGNARAQLLQLHHQLLQLLSSGPGPRNDSRVNNKRNNLSCIQCAPAGGAGAFITCSAKEPSQLINWQMDFSGKHWPLVLILLL